MLESEQRKMIERQLKAMPKASDRNIAALVGREPKEVGVVRRELLARGKPQTPPDG